MVTIAVRAANAAEMERISGVLENEGLRLSGNVKRRDFYLTAKFQGALREPDYEQIQSKK